jgi:3-phenylpropionate/trans-cinnamate dioxygenase ferredoxin reductase subunit
MTSVLLAGSDLQRVVIVGAGHGGCSVASLLRKSGYQGEVVLLSGEADLPYHRPPLSKRLLNSDLHQLLLEPEFYEEQNIDLKLSSVVVDLNVSKASVTLSDSSIIEYGVLVLATGVSASTLPILDASRVNVHEIRDISQARQLAQQLPSGQKLVVIGGGWIGLEIAASARVAGLDVTVVARGSTLLSRVASPELASFLLDAQSAHGVSVIFDEVVTGVESREGVVEALVLSSGRKLECDSVVVGIGAETNLDLARAAGLDVDSGIIVDDDARTSRAQIYAVGDITSRPVAGHDALVRFESIPSATEQAHQAVSSMLGLDAPKEETPWFWSDQFDLKIQIVGLRGQSDRVTVRNFRDEKSRFTVFHTRGQKLLCLEAINSPGDFMVAKQFIRDARDINVEALADENTSLIDTVISVHREDEAGEPSIPSQLEDLPGPGDVDGLARITFVKRDGVATTIDIEDGQTLMQGAVRNNVAGIEAECGGMATCGTCHVYVDEPWASQLPEMEYEEDVLIEFIENQQPNSRLGCQLFACKDLDGMVVRVAIGN